MQKVLVAVSLSLAAGFALGAWMITSDDESSESPTPAASTLGGDVEAQIRQLEQSLAAERSARRLLEQQVDELAAQLDQRPQSNASSERSERVAEFFAGGGGGNWARNAQARTDRMNEWRRTRLVEGGYTEDEAQRLLDAEAAAQLSAMQADWEAQRNGERTDPFLNVTTTQDIMRQQLGDAEYERYLLAQGSPASIQVMSVIDQGPGSTAGLQPGDEIVSYNGERTFSMTDLRRQTMQGEPGEAVIVEIDRDGVRMQLTVPRGPIGMNGQGASSRSFNWFGG